MIKTKIRLFFVVCLMGCIYLTASAKTDTITAKLTNFIKNINTFNKEYPQEKVYLHFDNTGYYLGETIWFKAYVVTAEEHLPTILSRVLYVELLNPEGDVVITKKLKVENGQCHGDFQLKDSLYAGYYEVRAYTRYMLNFGKTEYTAYISSTMKSLDFKGASSEIAGDYIFYPYLSEGDYIKFSEISSSYSSIGTGGVHPFGKICRENETIFTRVFPVYNRPEKECDYALKVMRERPRVFESNEQKIKTTTPFKVSFYPEGGNLVVGLSSKVTFKAISEQGENIVVKGVVKNSRGDEVCTFQTIHEGMGSFELTPDGTTYTAEVYYQNKVAKFDIPNALRQGHVMTVNAMSPKKLIISILQNETTASTVGITIGCRGKVLYYDTLSIKNEEPTLLAVNKATLRTGVNQITIFDSNGSVLADRLVFVNNEEYKAVTLTVKGVKILYKPYEPIQFDFQLTDSLYHSSETNFSVAVRDAETEEFTYPADNVLSNLLLSSDLKGYIANPTYYFESNDNTHRYTQDLLMLTQGWRRYEWKQMSGINAFKLNQPLEKGIIIDGVVSNHMIYKKNKKTEVSGAYLNMSLTLPTNQVMSGEYKTDTLGRFYAFVGDFYGVGKLNMNAFEKQKEKILRKYYITSLNRQFSPTAKSSYSYYQTNIPYIQKGDSQAITGTLVQNEIMSKVVNIKEVTVSAKKKQRQTIDFSKPNFRVDAQADLDKKFDEQSRSFTDPNILFPLYAFACIKRGIGAASFRVFADDHNRVYCNEKWVYQAGTTEKKTVYDIDSIYIYTDLATRNRYTSDRDKSKGIIPDIILKVKFFDSQQPLPALKGIRQTNLQGYSYVSEFYSPDYKNNALPEKKDFRRTLYWNPDVKTDSKGKAQVSFYNNSTCKGINISAETVTKEGVPVVVNPVIQE